ncbi:hypothetical protein BH24ACI3_BH24ACI3_02080 [soil metagenome]
MKTRVGILFGGRSGEHEVSIRSATAVIEEIDREKYDPVPIAISKEGGWLNPADSADLLPFVTQELLTPIEAGRGKFGLLGDRGYNGLTAIGGENAPSIGLDVVFPVLHGTFGEDGTVQGLLEMADIPYVGCGVLASACGMDKVAMKVLFRDAGLPICRYTWFLRGDWEKDRETVAANVKKEIGFPCFVKPANLGSSVGISRAVDSEELAVAVDLAAEYDRKIIVEEALKMREIECAVIGNDSP